MCAHRSGRGGHGVAENTAGPLSLPLPRLSPSPLPSHPRLVETDFPVSPFAPLCRHRGPRAPGALGRAFPGRSPQAPAHQSSGPEPAPLSTQGQKQGVQPAPVSCCFVQSTLSSSRERNPPRPVLARGTLPSPSPPPARRPLCPGSSPESPRTRLERQLAGSPSWLSRTESAGFLPWLPVVGGRPRGPLGAALLGSGSGSRPAWEPTGGGGGAGSGQRAAGRDAE